MSTPHPFPARTSLEQQHKLAKDLLSAARDGDPAALARIRAVRADAGAPARPLNLADAQWAIAREGGFDSWPKLVADFHERDVKAFCEAVQSGDTARAQQLLAQPHVGARVNDPLFAFGQRAAHIAAKNEPLLTALLAAGADLNLKSDWENGPYTVLDNADEPTARFLLARGATLTPNVAARLGWFAELQALIDADGALVHARGGDGQQPLHEAKTVAIADFLLDRGAGIDVLCIDHKIDAGAVRAGRSSGRLPPSPRSRGLAGHLHGRAPRRRRARHAPRGCRSRVPRRSRPRARLCAGSAAAHLLLVDRVRLVSARHRVEVRPSLTCTPFSSPAARNGSS